MKLGVVGDKQSVKGFAALGIDTFPVTNPDEVRRTIHKLAKEDYAVLFVTEQAVSMAEEAVNTYATSRGTEERWESACPESPRMSKKPWELTYFLTS